ncbi:tRNA guanosine(15) transglycosylase TgtA [Halococcus thailandensis]|uniref:tRNA-guanine(15) transglycosylase n=1 Tax=Halococcus thailandensis JCM 13552 TaxID=1227457 RepID=M0N4X3_9EURY|nr:tRNA guanosine(15) transglycosylase TgtA [Halococcus thailandensis]EMA52972.1 7-cyano-7-deazaguanine tRNA-ribosyltransferase [Halococcus thailandensis JCM 13552]
MNDVFELRSADAAGRIGELRVPRSDTVVETPALMPVVNPNLQTISPARLENEFGAEICITNGYIISQSDYREEVLSKGLHEFLDFSGAIMTDSGSFQLAEYGEIDVTSAEILDFQYRIGSDIGTPVDIPTPPEAGRERAADELATTQDRLESIQDVDTGEMLVNAPVQGGVYTDLRERAARDARATGLDIHPIGAVVPLMNAYEYGKMVDVVAAAKRGLGSNSPVHLFGAGHPMMFALAVALGCDLFDSAAYALYARDDRYLTVRGTERLSELEYLPCECPVCVAHTPDELRAMPDDERETRLAEHNLHVSFGELRRIKQAIRRGDLLELVEARARGHPAMLDGYRALLDHADQLEAEDSASKDAFFHLSAESARRPEVRRHHERLARLSVDGDILLTEGDTNAAYDESWRVVPPFGPFPRALSETYPLTAEVPERLDDPAYESAASGVAKLVAANPATEFTLAHRNWPERALETVPDRVRCSPLESMDEYEERGEGEP